MTQRYFVGDRQDLFVAVEVCLLVQVEEQL